MRQVFKPDDLYWTFIWLIKKLYYDWTPFRFRFFIWKVRGFGQSLFAPDRQQIVDNLTAILNGTISEREKRSIRRRHYKYLIENEPLHYFPVLKKFSNPKRWRIEGLQHLDDALQRGKGVILLSAHFGYAALLKYIVETKGYKVRRARARKSFSLKRMKQEKKWVATFSRFRRRMYQRWHLRRTGFDEDDLVAVFNIRPLVECLKRNEVLMLLADSSHSAHFIHLELLGQPYPFPTGFMSMAMQTGATILPTFVVDDDHGLDIKVVIEAPLRLELSGAPRSELLKRNLQQFVTLYDSYIRRYPHLMKIWNKDNWFETRRARTKKDVALRY